MEEKKYTIEPLKLRLKDPVEIEMYENKILIDRKDLPIFAGHSWYVEKGRGQTSYLRANVLVNGIKRTVFFHQMLLGFYVDHEIDHVNGNGLDNRRSNLRVVTHEVNQSNQRKRRNSSSKYFGVSFCKRDKKWQCHVTYKKLKKNVGRFDCEIDAANAYNNYLITNCIPKALNEI